MVVVCEPVMLMTCSILPPEHKKTYLVITPFGFKDASHIKESDIELLDIPDRLQGHDGTGKNNVS